MWKLFRPSTQREEMNKRTAVRKKEYLQAHSDAVYHRQTSFASIVKITCNLSARQEHASLGVCAWTLPRASTGLLVTKRAITRTAVCADEM